jgi:RND family efflux transporter MFP subunit
MPHSMLDLSTGVSGRLDRVHVDRAEYVIAGQVLAELESNVERANLKLARARAAMRSEVNLREARFEYDRRRQERIDNLPLNRVASRQEVDDAERDAVLAGWQVKVAKDNLYLAQLEASRAAATLELREVLSPFDGVVVERFKSPGEYVDEEPILRIARLDPLRVEVIVPIELHPEFHTGLDADVYPETAPTEPWRATVTAVDAVGDPASGTFRARLELPNPDGKLLAGIKCLAQLRDIPVVPSAESAAPELTVDYDENPGIRDPAPAPAPAPATVSSPTALDPDGAPG